MDFSCAEYISLPEAFKEAVLKVRYSVPDTP